MRSANHDAAHQRCEPTAMLIVALAIALALGSCAKADPDEAARFRALWRDPMFQIKIPGGVPGPLLGHAAGSYQTGDPLIVFRTWTVPAVTPAILADALVRERHVGLRFAELYCGSSDGSLSARGGKRVNNFWVNVIVSLSAEPAPTLRVSANGGQLPPHATQATAPSTTIRPRPLPSRATPTPTALPPLPAISGNCPQAIVQAAGLG